MYMYYYQRGSVSPRVQFKEEGHLSRGTGMKFQHKKGHNLYTCMYMYE